MVKTLFFVALLSPVLVSAAETVTIESLLHQMADRDSVARYPEHDFRLKLASSYNRVSKTPDDPEAWFANVDFNTARKSGNYVRVDKDREGKTEWVLMEHEGPGAIVRTWMPFRSVPKGVNIRFYLDGAEEPALEGNVAELLNGDGLIPGPFAHKSLWSAVSFFPIPYAKSCKITITGQPFFFNLTYAAYAEGTPVETFTMEDFEAAKPLIEEIGEKLSHPEAATAGAHVSLKGTLGKGEEKSVSLPGGTNAIRKLALKLGDYSEAEITRKVILKIEFDGMETVWCPIGDFFGSGVGLNPWQGWYRTVAEDGWLSSRWTMPYQQASKISVLNLSDSPVDIELSADVGDWQWDERSMYFNATWKGQYPVPTRPRSDWNYVTLKGRGVYVGDTLTIMTPTPTWWGEGDEKIWIDGEDFPSHFGTGTEDYYGYSWGGVTTDFYEHPFHAQPFANKFNKLNRKPANAPKDCRGYSTETRSRALDTMPFGSSLQLDMEVWAGDDIDMSYQVGVYWYGFADTTSNRVPDEKEVLNVPPLPDLYAPIKKKSKFNDEPLADGPAAKTAQVAGFDGAVEFEDLEVFSKPAKVSSKVQNLKRLKGAWSADQHVMFVGADSGDAVEWNIPAPSAEPQKLILFATKSRDYGILEISVNGQSVAEQIDLYSPGTSASGPIDLGVYKPVDGEYILRAKVVGKHVDSEGTRFGLDCVVLKSTK